MGKTSEIAKVAFVLYADANHINFNKIQLVILVTIKCKSQAFHSKKCLKVTCFIEVSTLR